MATATLPPTTMSIPDTSLPSLNFGFDDLRARMNTFTIRFDDFIERGRRRVLEERNQFRMSVAQVAEDTASRTRSLSTLSTATQSHSHNLSAQATETAEMHSAISSLSATRDTHLAALTTLRARLSSTRTAVAARKAAQGRHAEFLATQGGKDGPELEFWEEVLGMRVLGTGVEDSVRFVFLVEGGREVGFELEMGSGSGGGGNVGNGGYRVISSTSALSPEKVSAFLARMNGGMEDLAGFLKGMRGLFLDAIHDA